MGAVNTPPPPNVYHPVGILRVALRSVDGADLPAAEPGPRSVSEPSLREISEDSALVGAAQEGNRAAFGRLYERYSRMVHGVLLAKVPVADADDLLQEVFLKALRRLSTLRDRASFGAWLAAIARNLANDYHRHSLPEEQLADDSSSEDLPDHRDRGKTRAEHEGAAILDAIRALPDAYRETLILRLVEGLTGPEIASRTGMTHGSVRVNLHRGMEQLRAKLQPRASSDQPEQETL